MKYYLIIFISFVSYLPNLACSDTTESKVNNTESTVPNYWTKDKIERYVLIDEVAVAKLNEKNKKIIAKYYNEDKEKFYPQVTEEQKYYVYTAYKENTSHLYNEQLLRFDRMEKQPFLPLEARKAKELEIQKLLDQCITIIGPEKNDSKKLYLQQGDLYRTVIIEPDMSKYTDDWKEISKNIQGNYLEVRGYKCTDYLYGQYYSLEDFGYQASADKKKVQLEEIYTKAYLLIKQAGLLPFIDSAFYPKSLVRAHADQTGLTQFINEQEKQAGKTLKHNKLAVKYFGTRENWIHSLNTFINQKIKENK